jgi:hypothetical protein
MWLNGGQSPLTALGVQPRVMEKTKLCFWYLSPAPVSRHLTLSGVSSDSLLQAAEITCSALVCIWCVALLCP